MTSSELGQDAYNLNHKDKEEMLNANLNPNAFNIKEDLSSKARNNTYSDNINTNKKDLKSIKNSEMENNNRMLELNAVNLMEEMRNNNQENNYNQNNQFEEEGFQGNDQINFVQNLSEYNLSNYNSNKPSKEIRNNFQFAKTIVQIDDDKKTKDNGINIQNFDENLAMGGDEQKIFSGNNRSKVAFSVNSHSSNSNNSVAFLFINPNSGTQSGSKILDMGVKKVEFNDSDGMTYIYNMNDKDSLSAGLSNLKNQLDKGIKFLRNFLIF